MRYYVRTKGKNTRYRSGIQFGPEPVEIDTENMSQEAFEAILNDASLRCVPHVSKAKIEKVTEEILNKILGEPQAEILPEPEPVPEPEAVPELEPISEPEPVPEPEAVEPMPRRSRKSVTSKNKA